MKIGLFFIKNALSGNVCNFETIPLPSWEEVKEGSPYQRGYYRCPALSLAPWPVVWVKPFDTEKLFTYGWVDLSKCDTGTETWGKPEDAGFILKHTGVIEDPPWPLVMSVLLSEEVGARWTTSTLARVAMQDRQSWGEIDSRKGPNYRRDIFICARWGIWEHLNWSGAERLADCADHGIVFHADADMGRKMLTTRCARLKARAKAAM